MQQEIECKFLNVDHEKVRESLKTLGAVCKQPMRLMRRVMLDHSDNRFQNNQQEERLRVRDEGNKVTVTYKRKLSESEYPYESEVVVDSYDETITILENIGFHIYSFQESRRESWQLNNVEIVLDEWPWLNPYIEIEGDDEISIRQVALQLGFDWKEAQFGSVDTAYRYQYPAMTDRDSVGDIAEVKFGSSKPEWFEKGKE